MRDKRNQAGNVLIAVGVLLLVASALLWGYNLWENHRAGETAAAVLSQLPASQETEAGDAATLSATPADTVPAAEDLPLYVTHPDMEMPTVEIDGNSYIGRLDIPALELSLPVMSEWSYPNLKLAPCRYEGSAYQNDLIIAAHNFKRHFGTLRNLSYGDSVTFTDAEGNVFHYEVAEIEQLEPTAIEEMKDGGWALTLFTCTVGGSYRVTIRCVAV
jgi:sortase A